MPDVAYDANPSTGVYVYCSSYERGYAWFEVGGTSIGAPQWSALIALSGYRPPSGTGGNPALYTLAASGTPDTAPIADTAYYSLIESGNNGSGADDSTFANGAYCLVTGLGSPVAYNLVPALSSPNFSVSVTPSSQTVNESGTATYTVTITSLNSFSGTVGLSASVPPSGATFTLSQPTTVAPGIPGTATLTITTTSTAAGSYPFTITGSFTTASGSLLTQTGTATLVVVPPNFTISASPSSLSVTAGNSTTSKVTVTPSGGFTGTVSFSVTGNPSGVTCSLPPVTIPSGSSASGSSTLTVTTTSSAGKGTDTLKITGTSGVLAATTTVTLSVSKSRGLSFGPSF